MTKISGLMILSLIIICSCASDTQETASAVNEDDLIARLSPELATNPKTQQEKEKNQLINYAIDHNLDVRSTPSDIFYFVEKEGTGHRPTLTDKLEAHYEGSLLDGKIFDSSYQRNTPLKFSLQQMIKGWQEVFPLLKTGTKAVILIPSHLAYGSRGYPGLIPPNAPLRFNIELISINQ